jgi:hypothetical protein
MVFPFRLPESLAARVRCLLLLGGSCRQHTGPTAAAGSLSDGVEKSSLKAVVCFQAAFPLFLTADA